MHKRVMFKNMAHSGDIEDHVNKELAKIIHFLENEPTPIYIDMVLEPSKVHAHPRAELRIKSPHYDLVSHYEHEGVDMHGVINHVTEVMYHQLHAEKEKKDDQRKMRGRHAAFKKQR